MNQAKTPPLTRTHSAALAETLEHIEALGPAYVRAVQRVIERNSAVKVDLLVCPVDVARERATTLRRAFERGDSSEKPVLEAVSSLASVMEMVIREGR